MSVEWTMYDQLIRPYKLFHKDKGCKTIKAQNR